MNISKEKNRMAKIQELERYGNNYGNEQNGNR